MKGPLLCFFAFLIFLIFLPSAKTASTSTIPKVFDVKYSRDDYLFGRYLERITKQMKKKTIDMSMANRLFRSSFQTEAFKDYRGMAKKIYDIAKIGNSLKRFHKYCEIPSKEKEKERSRSSYPALKNALEDNLGYYCRRLFLTLLLKIKKKNQSEIGRQSLDYFKYALRFYLKKKNLDLLARYFKSLKEGSTLHRLISHYITDEYIAHNIKPHQKILSLMSIDEKITRHVQKVGLEDRGARKYFTHELGRVVRDFKNAMDEKDYYGAQTRINLALSFYKQNKQYIMPYRAWSIFVTSGKNFLYSGRLEKSLDIFKHALDLAQDTEQKNESLFYMIWPHILSGDSDSAVDTILKYEMIKNYDRYESKLRFWIAYTLNKNGQKKLAMELYRNLIDHSPLTFYSIIALKELNKDFSVEIQEKINREFFSPSSPDFLGLHNYTPKITRLLKRLLVWIKLKNDKFSSMEINDIVNSQKDDGLRDKLVRNKLTEAEYKKQITVSLTYLLNSRRQFLHTFRVLHGSIISKDVKIDENIVKLLFPVQYLSHIKKIENKLDPFLILSLIRQESAFNPEARSLVGARGLMQLMPNTARRFYRRIRARHLRRPKLNLKIGIKYLKKLIKKYDGNLVYTLAAYNAGEGRVKRWRKNIFISEDPLLTIESIPYKETRHYVKLIYRNIFFYKLLNDRPFLKTSLEDSFRIGLGSQMKIKI